MAKAKTSSETSKVAKPKVKRKGVIAKSKNSNIKTSKSYTKKYRGQGR